MSDFIPNVTGAFVTKQIGGFLIISSNMLQIAYQNIKFLSIFLMALSLVTSIVFAYVLG
jgi:hypothetical protein